MGKMKSTKKALPEKYIHCRMKMNISVWNLGFKKDEKKVEKIKFWTSEVIFVYIAPSYYHLLHLAYLTKCTKFSEYEVVGIYNCDLMNHYS